MEYTKFRVKPISGALGAEVFDIDLSKTLDNSTMNEIHNAFTEYVVLLFRDQDLSVKQHRDFASKFGKLIPHPYVTGVDEDPDLFEVVREPGETFSWDNYYHSDLMFLENPPIASALYQPVDEVFPGRSRHGLILWCPGLKGGSLMAMGQQKDRQGDLMVSWSEMPRSPGHVFYDRLQLVLIEGGFDGFAEAVCQPYYAARMGAPSVPPGRYFRMHLVGYFEGIDSERGLEWRCSDSLSLREFLLLEMRETGAGPFLAVTDPRAPAP